MTEPWLCQAGDTLRGQVNKRWPKRDKASDGWIGDASHQASPSDHNPCWSCTGDRYGVVRAIDLDRDLDPADRTAMERLASQLRRYAQDREDNDRLAYIIFDGAIASETYGWRWRPYSGTNPHDHHMHVSFHPPWGSPGGPVHPAHLHRPQTPPPVEADQRVVGTDRHAEKKACQSPP